MKLEVGQFVRTNDGYINKIKKVNQFNVLIDGRDLFGEELNIPNNEITKASYNIIDILEKGDYVNGDKIFNIDDCKGAMRQFYYDYENPNDDVGHWEEEIKSVITHEQMEQMEYKVGE